MSDTWSKWIEEAGLKARLFEWPGRPAYYYDFTDPLSGKRTRRSTKRTTKKAAEDFVKEVLTALAEEGKARTLPKPEDVTLGAVFKAFFELKVPRYRDAWQKASKTRRKLFEEAWGQDKKIEDIDQDDLDRFADLRRTGELHPEGSRITDGVRDGTIEADIRWLSTVLNWAHKKKIDGKRLAPSNPVSELERPQPKNVRRPTASHTRYVKTLEKADKVDSEGRLACMLSLARYTGHRENAICQLHASDFLRTPEDVAATLAALGHDERRADHFPHGGLRWRAESDKQEVDHVTPLSKPAREALDAYLERNPRIGEAPLFPAPGDDTKPIRKDLAGDWLVRAEGYAKLPKLAGGRWHPYRRLWAQERKHLPAQDVAAAGGWNDTQALEDLYQKSDPATVLDVVNAGTGA